MTKRSVDDMYGGRHVPSGQPHDRRHPRIESEPSMESGNTRGTAFNRNINQDPEDQHDDHSSHGATITMSQTIGGEAAAREGRRASRASICTSLTAALTKATIGTPKRARTRSNSSSPSRSRRTNNSGETTKGKSHELQRRPTCS